MSSAIQFTYSIRFTFVHKEKQKKMNSKVILMLANKRVVCVNQFTIISLLLLVQIRKQFARVTKTLNGVIQQMKSRPRSFFVKCVSELHDEDVIDSLLTFRSVLLLQLAERFALMSSAIYCCQDRRLSG